MSKTNMQNLKSSRNEHKSIAYLAARGFRCLRATGQFDLFNVVGVSATELIFVRVKNNQLPDKPEIEKLKKIVLPSNSRKLIHIWKPWAKAPIVRDVDGVEIELL